MQNFKTVQRLLGAWTILEAYDFFKNDITNMGRQQFGDRYISSHPIAGSDKSGLGQTIPNMFDHKDVIILDKHLIGGDKAGLSLVEKFWSSIGMKLKYVSTDIKSCDRWRSESSHLSQSKRMLKAPFWKSLFSYHVMSTIEFSGLYHIFHNTSHIKRSIRLFWHLIIPQKGLWSAVPYICFFGIKAQ